MITHAEILRRARALPPRSDPYSQSVIDNDGPNAGYRADCSGFVSYCWGVPKSGPGTWGGYSTSTFVTTSYAPGVVGIMYEIPRAQLKPGDAIGHCGPTTGGNGGHIALWLGRDGLQERILDHGGGWGPVEHSVTWGVGGTGWNSAGKIRAFRFRGVNSDGGSPVSVTPATIKPGATFPLASGHYYGPISGPAESHGGFYPAELPVIAAIQVKLIGLSMVPGVSAGTAAATAWADGRYESPTTEAVKRYQTARKLTITGRVDAKTWAALFPAPVVVTPPPATTPGGTTPAPATIDVNALAAALVPMLLPGLVAAVRAAVPGYTVTLAPIAKAE